MNINIALAGAGAFGLKHLDALKAIDGARVVSLVGRERGKTEEIARKYGVPHVTTDLAEALRRKEVDAVILCTPTPLHAAPPARPTIPAALAAGACRSRATDTHRASHTWR